MQPLPKHSKQVFLEFSGVLKLPEQAHLEQITLKQEIEFSVRESTLKKFYSSIFNLKSGEIFKVELQNQRLIFGRLKP